MARSQVLQGRPAAGVKIADMRSCRFDVAVRRFAPCRFGNRGLLAIEAGPVFHGPEDRAFAGCAGGSR